MQAGIDVALEMQDVPSNEHGFQGPATLRGTGGA